MPAGTIALTNGSTTVNGTGTSFTTELKPGDFVYVTVGGAPFTLVASTITSNTQLTLAVAFDGPTTSGLSWNAMPASLQVAITQKILNDFAQVARGRILDYQNWQKIYSSVAAVTVTRPDRTTFTGPSWGYMATQFDSKANTSDVLTKAGNLANLADKAQARTNLGLGDFATATGSIPINQGGTGATTAPVARNNLGLGSAAVANVQTSTNDTTAGALMPVGAFGLGATVSPSVASRFTNVPNSFVRSTGENDPYGCGVYMHYNETTLFHIMAEGAGNLRFRLMTAGSTTYNNTCYHTGNTTKASDGTLKAASPVARVVASKDESSREDISEEGFTWCGCGTSNVEAEGISISRLDTGTYVLTGSAGLASEGWQLLPPRDPQGAGDLGIVEADQTDSGGLTIRLYKRRYKLTDDGDIEVVKGDLIDVPANSWIDVRLDMPEDSAYKLRMEKLLKDAQQEEEPGS